MSSWVKSEVTACGLLGISDGLGRRNGFHYLRTILIGNSVDYHYLTRRRGEKTGPAAGTCEKPLPSTANLHAEFAGLIWSRQGTQSLVDPLDFLIHVGP